MSFSSNTPYNINLFGDLFVWSTDGILGSGLVNFANSLSFTILTPESAPSPTPIPGAIWLLGSGLAGLVALRRRMQA